MIWIQNTGLSPGLWPLGVKKLDWTGLPNTTECWRVSEAETDPETDRRPGVHRINPGEHQPETRGVAARRVGRGRN